MVSARKLERENLLHGNKKRFKQVKQSSVIPDGFAVKEFRYSGRTFASVHPAGILETKLEKDLINI